MSFEFYPNPTQGRVNFELNLPEEGMVQISVYNSNGELVKDRLINSEFDKGYHEFNFDLEELNDIYNSFHTDSEWYDLTKTEGKEIGNSIFSLTTELINEFESGNIIELIKDFTNTVNKGVQILKDKYGVSDLLEGWHSGLYEQTGKLKDLGIEFYAFHGCGLALHFRNKKVDFDFAHVPDQRHDGFDLWRLHGFAQGQPKKYNKYLDKTNLEKDFKQLLKKEIICLPAQDNSPKQYFLTNELRKTMEIKNTNR